MHVQERCGTLSFASGANTLQALGRVGALKLTPAPPAGHPRVPGVRALLCAR